MDFTSGIFYLFCLIFFMVFYLIPNRFRYIVIFIGSYIFYGYGNPSLCIFLAITTLITYIGGIVIEKKRDKKTLLLFYLSNILILLIFKYTNFAIQNINSISNRLGGILHFNETNIILPVGLSFYIFQTCTYLMDIYKNRMDAEKNIVVYAAFASFFPTILSGPIQKARELLPQIRRPSNYSESELKKGVILFVWGLFEKILVANNLLVIVNAIFDNLENYRPIYYIIAACSFSLYIYADFSSYSDMARGISKMLGINISKNFNNPYLALSTSEFWNRWHVSLNEWFIDNIYIPLGGNRRGTVRKYINVMVVFFVSGLWHGAAWHFVVWGLLNGGLVIFGQLLSPFKKKIYAKINIDENVESIVFIKRVINFIIITITWIFFRNGISESTYILRRILSMHFISFFDTNVLAISGTDFSTFITLFFVIVFCMIQFRRQDELKCFNFFIRQPEFVQIVTLAFIIVICTFFSLMPYAEVDTQFLYFQF